MTALITREPDLSRLLVASHIGDITRLDREMLACNLANDPDGYRGAALEMQILELQASLLKEASALLGVTVDRLARALGI